MTSTHDTGKSLDKLHGCLVGGAIGDAFGYVIEFDHLHEIVAKYGEGGLTFDKISDWVDRRGKVMVSDDTQMTLFTAEACNRLLSIRKEWTQNTLLADLRLSYLDWLWTQVLNKRFAAVGKLASYKVMQERRAPGNTCMSACRSGANGTVATPINDSMGCGGVMRVAPLAFLPGLDDDGAWEIGCGSAAITHGNPMGYMPAGALVWLLRRLKEGQGLHEAVHTLAAYLQRHQGTYHLVEAISAAVNLVYHGVPSYEEIETLGGGWVGHECLAIALAAASISTTVERKFEIAANHSGDSDSTAAVTGNILGAQFGISWLRESSPSFRLAEQKLDVAAPLTEIMADFKRVIT